jgi:hypothetical protein
MKGVHKPPKPGAQVRVLAGAFLFFPLIAAFVPPVSCRPHSKPGAANFCKAMIIEFFSNINYRGSVGKLT